MQIKNQYSLKAVLCLGLVMMMGAKVQAQISLTATAGTTTGSYTTLGAAFAAINAGTHTGVINIGISSSTTETGPCVLNSSGAGSASYTSIVVNPTADGVAISGATATGRGLIELNGADNVTINGDNPNTSGINRNLTISNTASSTITYTSVIRIASSTLVTSNDNDTITNLILTGSGVGLNTSSYTSTSGAEATTFGIIVARGANTTTATTAPSALSSSTTLTVASGQTVLNFTATNNEINSCATGIAFNGAATSVCPVLTITNNIIGNSSAAATSQVYLNGITAQGYNTGTSISGNTIYLESYLASTIVALDLGSQSANGSNAVIERNNITRVYSRNTSAYGAWGIKIATTTSSTNLTVRNNFISNLQSYYNNSATNTSYGPKGIVISAGATNIKIYHNTVSLYGIPFGTGGADLSACLMISSSSATADIRNNLFSNTISGSPTGSVDCVIFLTTGLTGTTINNNGYYTGTSTNSYLGETSASTKYTAANFNAAATTPSTNWRAYTSGLSTAGTNDNASFASTSAAPFISATNLHITAAVSTQLESGGAATSATGVTTDIDGQTRPGPTGSVNGGGTAPDIGADEFDGIPALPPTVSSATASAVSCTANIAHTITANIVANTGTVSSVTLNYNNGSAGSTTMTLLSGTTTNGVWTGTIPAAGTTGTTVTWSITTTNSVGLSSTFTGTSYKDIPFNGITATATANPASVCSGSSTSLITLTNTGTFQVGAGGSTSSSSGSPFYHTWGGAKVQYIYTAAELNAAGLGTGNITALALNVTSVGTSYAGFTVSVGTTSQSTFSSANTINTLTAVYTSTSYTPVSGANTFTFSSPFFWNGTDNIVVSICWSNANTGGSSSAVQWDTYTGNVGMYIYADNQSVSTVCGATTTIAASGGSNTTTGRPVTIFSGSTYVPISSYSWSNGTTTVGTTNPLTVTPAASTTYTATLTGAGGCTITSSSAAVTLLSLPSAPTATNSTQCGIGVPTASVSGATGSSIYKWYSAATGGTLLQTGGSTYTTSVSTTTTLYVAINNGTCESARTAVTVTVNIPDAVTATTTSAAKCISSPISLTATKAAGTNTYTYTWTASPTAGSGIATSLTGATVTPTPTIPGTYVYTVTAVDGPCTAVSTISVTVNSIPTGVTATATAPNVLCLGNSISLSSTPSVSATLLSENFNSATNSWTTANNSTGGTTPAGTAWFLRPDGYTYGTSTTFHSNDNSQFYITNSDTGGSGILVSTTLQSPSFSTVGYTACSLQFYHYYRYLSSSTRDSGTVEVSTNGTTWTPVQIYKGANVGGPTAFALADISLNAYLNQPTLYIRFRYTSGWGYYWSIDNVTVTGTNVGYTYAWSSTPAGYTSTVQNPGIVTPATAGTFTYTATVTNAAGCSVSASTLPVVINPLPAITVTPAAAAVCIGSGISLTAAGASTYAWSPTATLSAATGATVTAAPTTTTTYKIIGTDSKGCRDSVTKIVTVNPLPSVAISPATATAICAGSGVSLTAGGASTYAWTPVAGLSAATGATVTASPAATTTYTVTGTDVNGCKNTATKAITVNSLPAVAISPSTAIAFCGSGSASLTASGATSYAWSPATGLSSTTGSAVTATPSATTTYTVTGTDANGCVNTATKTVTINPLPTVGISPATAPTICSRRSVALTASGAVTYSWSPATGLSASTGATVSASPSTTTTYTVTGTDANGCTNTASQTVNVLTSPTVSISPATATAICIGSSVSLTAIGATGFAWTPSTGLSSTTSATVTANPTSTTTYSVVGTAANGCTDTATKTVTVNPLPTLVISPAAPTSICIGSAITLTAGGASTYSWSPGTGLSATTGSSVSASPSASTTYTITGTDANGCVNTITRTVTVNSLPSVSISPATASVICAGNSVTLTASGTTSYSWSPSTGLNTTTGATVIATPATTTTYTLTGTNANGCSSTATKTITVNPLPPVSISPATAATICSGSGITLTASGASTYSWSPGTGLSATTGSTVTANPSVSTTYTVTGTGTNGCVATATKLVTVLGLPTVTISPTTVTTICPGTGITLIAGGASTYSWTPTSSLSSGTGAVVTASPLTTTTYTVTGTAANGCISTATKTVNVRPKPDATITPRGNVNVCQGDTVYLTANPGFITYIWKIYGVTVTPATASVFPTVTGGFYTLTVIDTSGCVATTDSPTIVTITQRPVVRIRRISGTTMDAGPGYGTYQWYLNGTPITGATSQTYTAQADGTYTVAVTEPSALMCRAVSPPLELVALNVGGGSAPGDAIRLYPNPASNILSIDAAIPVSATVTSMDGKEVFFGTDVHRINVSNWADGVYRVVLRDKNGVYLRMEKITKVTR